MYYRHKGIGSLCTIKAGSQNDGDKRNIWDLDSIGTSAMFVHCVEDKPTLTSPA